MWKYKPNRCDMCRVHITDQSIHVKQSNAIIKVPI